MKIKRISHRTQFSFTLSGVFVLLTAAGCSPGQGRANIPKTITVSSMAELELNIASAIPGDTIVVKDGVYAHNDSTNDGESHIFINGRNLAAPGLVIRAETMLGVTLQGENAIRIYNSSHITFSGFRLHQNTILAWDQDGTPLSPDPGGGVVKHAGVEIIDSDHITFERNHIDISEDVKFEQNWILIDEKENELDGIDHSTEDVGPYANSNEF